MVFHESAHALAAGGLDETIASRAGFATLNPWPHLRRSPFGMVAAPLLSLLFLGNLLGWASVEVDLIWMIRNPRRAIAIYAAGPAANLLLALAGAVVLALGLHHRGLAPPAHLSDTTVAVSSSAAAGARIAARGLSIFFSLNLSLCLFNLLPFPFLDGGRIGLILLGAYRPKLPQRSIQLRVLLLIAIFLNLLHPAEALLRFIPRLFYPRPLAVVTGENISDFLHDSWMRSLIFGAICLMGCLEILLFWLGMKLWRRWRPKPPPPGGPAAGNGGGRALA
ncbi:MAG TPA: site-2 protease family protein, partial [Opitutaceae bacterium]|nr:site-2 protease family protein [Opitutaceae bacterium]